MRPLFAILVVLAATCAPIVHSQDQKDRLVRDTGWQTPEAERASFHLPDGFEIQLFADDAQLGGKPINMAFDARGRLWVSSTQEYPFAVKKEKWSADTTRAHGSKDSIRILEDTDGDGRADKVTVFADDLNIPTGVQPYKSGCIAWSIPNILYLEDTRAARNDKTQNTKPNELPPPTKADKRTILFGPLGYERDTHGMVSSMRLGLDGWIYATHGFSNTSHFRVLRKPTTEGTEKTKNQNSSVTSASSVVKNGGQTLDITSGSVFRFKPDGSAVELWTSGQVNPFGLCWDSWGNLYSADCHSSPLYQLIRGATYPQFGKPADALGFGPVMCEHAHGSTGICGPVYIDGGVWGPDWDDHMFVCNPVTSKINHDHITFTGSTPKANEQPDFITSDDGWFRPVDLQLGPDSALYIADFYNKIIGHYEVPLDHPGRDRASGRIWRVVKKGSAEKLADWNLAKQSDEDLVDKTNTHLNPMIRRMAYSELASREYYLMPNRPDYPVRQQGKADVPARKSMTVRHTISILMQPPHTGSIPNMLDWFRVADDHDTHLRHAFRVALRESLQLPGGFETLSEVRDIANLEAELIRIACAVPKADAANWLLERIKTSAAGSSRREEALNLKPKTTAPPQISSSLLTSAATLDRQLLTQAITHIARHLPAEREGELVTLVQRHFADNLDMQLELYAAVRQGRTGKDGTPAVPSKSPADGTPAVAPSIHAWANTLAGRLTDLLQPHGTPDWLPLTPPTTTNPSPWFRAMRKCADGTERAFLDSHPPGGEKLTGALRSKAFALPKHLSFWIAGHRGFPKANAHDLNFVRLVEEESGRELALAHPPRHDTAQKVEWNLEDAAKSAKLARLEFTDGDSGNAYAWLAAGGFEPEVVGIPELGAPANDKRIRAAAELAALWETKEDPTAVIKKHHAPAFPNLVKRLRNLPQHVSYSPDTRVALAKIDAFPFWPAELPELARDPELAATVFDVLGQGSPEKADLTKAFKPLTSRAQVKLASALATTRESATALLDSAPPRVLADPLVAGKLRALGDAALSKKHAETIAKLPPPNNAVNALIAGRLKSYDPGKADAARGEQVFTAVCFVCHRIGVRGNLVGPQLDGIGARGAERLLEDLLDPNRAVDPAFRLHIVKLKNGGVMSGLLRRSQDDALVFADAAAQEHTVQKTDITADEISEFSLMPAGLGEALTEQQLHDLLKYLLERK